MIEETFENQCIYVLSSIILRRIEHSQNEPHKFKQKLQIMKLNFQLNFFYPTEKTLESYSYCVFSNTFVHMQIMCICKPKTQTKKKIVSNLFSQFSIQCTNLNIQNVFNMHSNAHKCTRRLIIECTYTYNYIYALFVVSRFGWCRIDKLLHFRYFTTLNGLYRISVVKFLTQQKKCYPWSRKYCIFITNID